MQNIGSKQVAAAALQMALSESREDEKALQSKLNEIGVLTTAVDFGGEFISSVTKIIERSVVAARREGIIGDKNNEEGAVAGAAREAVSQIINKAIGLNVGGKIGIARYQEHVCVALFFGIGLLHLNEISVGLGHRAV